MLLCSLDLDLVKRMCLLESDLGNRWYLVSLFKGSSPHLPELGPYIKYNYITIFNITSKYNYITIIYYYACNCRAWANFCM